MIKTYTVRCNGELHRFGFDDHAMEISMLDHDLEAEEIAVQLGAEVPCIASLQQDEHGDWVVKKWMPL